MSKIVKNYIYNVLFQMLVMFIPLILSPFLVRTLGAEQLGVYSFVTSTANVVVTIGLLGTYNYGCRQIAYWRDDQEHIKSIYAEITTLRVILGLAITIVYAILILIEQEYRQFFAVYYTWVLSMVIDQSWVFVGMEDMKPTVVKNTVIKMATLVLIFMFVRDKEDLILYVLFMGGFSLLANSILVLQTKRFELKFFFRTNDIKKHLKSSLAFFWPQVASLLYLQVDKIMIRYLSPSIKEVSYYDYGEKIVTIPLTFITVLSTVMMPRIANEFAKKNDSAVKNLLNNAASFSLMMAIPMMFGLAICASDLIPWYLGEDYSLSVYVIVVISPIIVMNSLAGISGNQYFVATNQMGIVLKAYISAAIANICINAVLIPRMGCVGAGIATTIAATCSVVVQYYHMNKQLGIIVFVKNAILYFTKSIPMIIVVFCTVKKMPATYLSTIIEVLVGVSVYGATLIITKDTNIQVVIAKIKKKLNRQ